jgi:hypothetical protein
MPTFSASKGSFTPSATCNWGLWADTAGEGAIVTKITWGGEAAASQPARTRWARPSAAATVITAPVVPQSGAPRAVTAGCSFGILTTTLALAAGESLYMDSWNAFGGTGIYNLEDYEAWQIINATALFSQIVCAQDVNTNALCVMSAGVVWRE